MIGLDAIIKMLLWMLALYLIPGWAFLSVTKLWQKWAVLQRWILAVGISIAFFPILFYFSRAILPGIHLGRNKLILLFILLFAIIAWFQRKDWRSQFSFKGLEWLGLAILAGTLVVRFSLAYRDPIPAWSDSLHHTLITQLTALNGQLPYTLEPYEPSVFNMYHLGLYSLSGTLQILSGAPAHSALLWTAQLLNGLCGIGIYLFLDRLIGRRAAVIGAMAVGFWSFQPNWYFNWGRFTQVSSQAILLIAWVVTWETIRCWQARAEDDKLQCWSWVVAAGMLNAGVFLLHFRVAGYYVPLLILTVLFELGRGIKQRTLGKIAVNTLVVGVVSLFLVGPAIGPSLSAYIDRSQEKGSTQVQSEDAAAASEDYYGYNLESVFVIGAKKWLLWVTAAALVLSLIFYPRISLMLILWSGLLWLEGNANRFDLPYLSFTNYTAIMIFYYIPIGLILGMAGEAILKQKWLNHRVVQTGILGSLVIAAGVAGTQRWKDIEPYRHFVTSADLSAMNWIKENTDPTALFAINTFMWLGNSPHGTDGGYWIPYFTDRSTTSGTMMYSLGGESYINKVRSLSSLAVQAVYDPQAVKALVENGVDYIYIGAKGNFTGQGLNPELISQSPAAELVYSVDNVSIFKLTQ